MTFSIFNHASRLTLAALALFAPAALAAPLVNITLQGSTDGGITFNSGTIAAAPGASIKYRVIAQIASMNTTNNGKTITTRTDHPNTTTGGYDGVNGASFTLTTGTVGSFGSGALASNTGNSGDDYTKLTGSSSGTQTASSISNVIAGLTSGFYDGANVPAVLFTGNYTVSSLATANGTIDIAYSGSGAAFGINANTGTGALSLANKISVGATDTNGYLGFTALTIAVPEPTSLSLLAVGSLTLLRRRNKKARANA